MKKAQTQIISVAQGDNVLHFSIAQKQSQTGFMFNSRLIVLKQGQSFGYISKFDIKDDPKKIDLKKIKYQIPIKQIKAIDHDKQNLFIKFIHIQNNKQQPRRWVFKMTNQQLIQSWSQLLKNQKTKRAAKSSQKRSQSRKGSGPLSPLKGGEKLMQKQNKGISQQSQPYFQVNRKEQQKRQQPQPQQYVDDQNQQFVNPLYGYDSMESQVPQKPNRNNKPLQQAKKPIPQSPKKILQSNKKILQSPKKIPTSPKRQNNFVRQNSFNKKNNNKLIQQNVKYNQYGRSNLQFKQSPQLDKLSSPKKLKNQQFLNNSLFDKKPRESYVDMIQKIVKQSQQKTIDKYKQRNHQKYLSGQNNERQAYVNGILQQFIRYDTGQTQNWRKQRLNDDYEGLNKKRQEKQTKQLQQLQQLAINLQKDQRNLYYQQLSPKPINYNDFSKQIALMIRNKRFQRQGHQQISPQKQNDKKQIDIKTMPFSYRYLLSTSPALSFEERQQDLMDVLVDWKQYCQDLMKKIITDLVLKQGKFKQKGKRNNIMYYQIEQIQVKISTAYLKTVQFSGKQKKKQAEKNKQKKQQRISDYSSGKDLQIQFKNYSAINELLEQSQVPLKQVKQNNYQNMYNRNRKNYSSRLKVPLISVVQYCGFIGLFKLNSKYSYRQNDINQKYIKQKQQHISQISNIQIKWLQQTFSKNKPSNKSNQDNQEFTNNRTLILHVDQNYYAQLHLQRNSHYYQNKHKKTNYQQKIQEIKDIFNVDVIQQLDSFLIKDYLTKSLANGVLRKQLIEEATTRDQYRDKLFINPNKVNNQTLKSQLQADLTLLSGQILQKLSGLILKLDHMEFYYLHPQQISQFFHKQGVNIRYMGLAFDNLNQGYAKKCLMTQIAARVTKLLLRKTIQDVLLQNELSQRGQSPSKSSRISKIPSKNGQLDITPDVIDFLNCIIGSSQQSSAMWKVLSIHSQYYFKCQLNKQFIDTGYFLISLAYHCRLNINWKNINQVNSIFHKQQFFNHSNLLGLNVQSKTYQPINSKLFNQLKSIQTFNKNQQVSKQQVFLKLVQSLQLSKNPLPHCLQCFSKQSKFSILSIKQLLSNFVRPETIKISTSDTNFGHLRVFNQLNQFPQKKSISIKISQIKWYLRLNKKQKYLKKFEQLINLLNKFYGDFSPVMGQLYDVFSSYHIQNGQYEDAITFAKSSLVNTLKICGTNHLKTGESYYKLSLCYLKSNKVQDAYNMLKKSKSIYESKQKTTTQLYGLINLRLGILMLNKNEIKQCIGLIQTAIETFDQIIQIQEQQQSFKSKKNQFDTKTMFENQKIQCYETLVRCYQLNKNKQGLKIISIKMQQKILYNIQSTINLQKALRLIFTPYFQSLNSQQAAKYIDLISVLTSSNPVQLSPKSYNKAYSLIKNRLKQNTLIQNVQSYLQNFASICDYIMLNNTLKNWKSFQKQFERETINDFICITEQLVFFLGQGYITGILRQTVQNSNHRI